MVVPPKYILAKGSNRSVRMESIFQETWNIKKIEKNEFKIGDYSSFKISKIYFQKKLLCCHLEDKCW